jgi:hypothetical protein
MPFSLSLGLTDDLTKAQDRWSQWWMNPDHSIHEAPPNQDYFVTREIAYGGIRPKFCWRSDDNTAIIWWRVNLTNRQVQGQFQFLVTPTDRNRYHRWFRRGRNMLTWKMDTQEEFASAMLAKQMSPQQLWTCCEVYARLLNCLEPAPTERHEMHSVIGYDS